MKIWIETAGDHSSALRIVGNFKTEDDAQKAVDRINSLLSILGGQQTTLPNGSFSKEVLDYIMENNFQLSPEAVDSCKYHYPIDRRGNRIIVETDELAIQIFLEAFISCGGKLEIYSRHDY